uniref:Uncharacterized protein n=1 Tax=Cannabis sativa TaxID=3483 RepID=A0A803R0V6_CANSA
MYRRMFSPSRVKLHIGLKDVSSEYEIELWFGSLSSQEKMMYGDVLKTLLVRYMGMCHQNYHRCEVQLKMVS